MTILRYMMIKVQCLPAFLMWQFSDIWWIFFVQLTVSSRETCFNWSQRRFWCWTRFGRKYDQECVLMDWQVLLLWSNMLWLMCEFTVEVSSYCWKDCWRKTSWQPEMSWILHVNRARAETCCVEEKYMTEKLFWCLLKRSEIYLIFLTGTCGKIICHGEIICHKMSWNEMKWVGHERSERSKAKTDWKIVQMF